MSLSRNDVQLTSFPVGESDTNITSVTFGHRSGKLLATGSEDHTIHIYLIGQINSLLTSQCQTSAITALRFSNEENMLASGSRSGAIKICDLESQKVIYPGGHKTCIRAIEYFPSSNNFLATAAVDGTAKLWDPRRKGFIFNYKGHNGAINALKFSPDGRYLATASDDTAIRMWDVTAGKVIKAFEEHQGPVHTLEYHPQELLLASGSADRRIKFWDLEKCQFICETEMEASAIKCLAFEPNNANYILSGSNDLLRAHTWEPVQLLDRIQTGWKNIVDMTIHKDQLLGASISQNRVNIGSVQLSNLKTKRRISPVRDYFPSDPKSIVVSTNTPSGRRSQYQLTRIKDENVKTQPESTQSVPTEDSKQSANDSLTIDNQTDYNQIFHPKTRLTRSPSKQGVPSCSSGGFIAAASPPAQIDLKTSPPTVVSNSVNIPSRTNEQIFIDLSKANQTISSLQQQRMRNLTLLTNLSRNTATQTVFQAILASHDLSLECFLLRFVLEKLSKRDWNLELCSSILPAIRDLIQSNYHWYNLTAGQTLEKILTNFGKIIFDNVGARSIGVDLSQQARRDKCQSCHNVLYEIRFLLEERLKTVTDLSLRQTFDDNLRLLNACEHS